MNIFKRIVLTGFRATGKTAVGRELAKLLRYDFVDTDIALCHRFGCSVDTFVNNHGWLSFRDRERQLLVELAACNQAVIATGGGSVLHKAEWRMLRRDSLVIWLQADIEVIKERLSRDPNSKLQRPSLTGEDINHEVDFLLAEREPLYKAGSDIIIDSGRFDPTSISVEIKKVIDDAVKF